MAMILSMVSVGFAAPVASDVVGTDYEKATIQLSAVDIMNGFPDGTFKPEQNVTRAQFAKMAVVALDLDDAAKLSAGTTKFADVSADHWASGYINIADQRGLIKGYPDKTFNPEGNVTYAESLTILVRAVGLGTVVEKDGVWPANYVSRAAQEGISDGVAKPGNSAAIRGDVAKLFVNTLDVPMWGATGYEDDGSVKYGPLPGVETMLDNRLDLTEVDEDDDITVNAVELVKSTLDADEIEMSDGNVYTLLNGTPADYLGLQVEYWYNDDDEIVWINAVTDADDVIYDSVDTATATDVTLVVDDDDDYDLAAGITVYENNSAAGLAAGQYGRFLLNDDDEVTFAYLFDFDTTGFVSEVAGDEITYYDASNANDYELDLADYDDVYVYDAQLNAIDADEIAVDSVIAFWDDADEIHIIVTNDAVTGNLDRAKDDVVKIDGTNYDAAAAAIYSNDDKDDFATYTVVADVDALIGEDVTALLNVNGEAVLVYGASEVSGDTIYGVVTYADKGADSTIKVYTKEDAEFNYDFDKRADLDDTIVYDATGAAGYDYYALATAADFGYAVVGFELNSDGEIHKDFVPATDMVKVEDDTATVANITATNGVYVLNKDADDKYFTAATADTDGDLDIDGNDTTVNFYITEDTVLVKALDSNELDPSLETYKSVVDSDITNQVAVVMGDAGRDADIVVFMDNAFAGTDDDDFYGVVTSKPEFDGDDWFAGINVFENGAAEYKLENKADYAKAYVAKFTVNTSDEAVADVATIAGFDTLLDTFNDTDADGIDDVDDNAVDAASITNAVLVQDTDDDYIKVGGTWIKVSDDAVFYDYDADDFEDGSYTLGEQVKASKIDAGDYVIYLVDSETGEIVAGLINLYAEDVQDLFENGLK